MCHCGNTFNPNSGGIKYYLSTKQRGDGVKSVTIGK